MAEPRVRFDVGGGGAATDVAEKRRHIWETEPFTADLCETLVPRHQALYGDFCVTMSGMLEAMLGQPFPHPAARSATIKMVQALQRSEAIFRRRQQHMSWRIQFHLSRICDDVCKQLHASSVGDLHIFPFETSDSGIVVVTQERAGTFRCGVVNINPQQTEYHPCTSDRPPKLLMRTVLEVKNVPKLRITSEAFWAAELLSDGADEQVPYTHLLPWLNGKTHADIVDDSSAQQPATGTKCDSGNLWKTFVHAYKYVLRLEGCDEETVKAMRLLLKRSFLLATRDDLLSIDRIPHSTRLIVRSAIQNGALALSRSGRFIGEAAFHEMRELIDALQARVDALPCPDEDTTKPPALLNLTSGWERAGRLEHFPLAECHRRIEDTNGMIGTAVDMPHYVPVNFFRVPDRVATFDDALSLVDDVVQLCTRITCQRNVVKNSGLLILSLITSVFTEVLPVPLGPKSRAARPCVWAPAAVLYGQQLHCMKRLWQCAEYFIWASFSTKTTKEFDAQRIIVLGAIASACDAVIRLVASDHPSVVAQHLRGYRRKAGFAVSVGRLASQTENSVIINPELVVARAAVLDYHAEMCDEVPNANVLWAWEDGNSICKASVALLRQICQAEGFRMQAVMNFFSFESEGQYCVIGKYWEELRFHRDVYILFKWMMAPKAKLPTCAECLSCRVMPPQLQVDYHNFKVAIRYMHREVTARAQQLRFPSFAIPSRFTAPFEAYTEDDILHIKNLPSFDDAMGQRDSELLLSYLTAPYVRIPLILNFFATEDRVACLGNPTIRNLLDAALFEPGKFLPRALQDKVPAQVPSEDSALLATPYGLLVNEFLYAPHGVVTPLLLLVRLAREMDAGTVFNTSVVDIIRYLVRVTGRVENYLAFTLRLAERAASGDARYAHLRGVALDAAQMAALRAAHAELRAVVATELMPMLEAWNDEVMASVLKSDASMIDGLTHISAELHAHQLLLLRNAPALDRNLVSLALSSIMFLTTRHTFNTETLDVPESELFDTLQLHRRGIVRWLYEHSVADLGFVLDSVVRVATSTGKRLEGPPFAWGYVAGADCAGRFTRVDDDATRRPGFDSKRPELLESIAAAFGYAAGALPAPVGGAVCVNEGQQDVEVNVHTLSLTFKAAHLIALPSQIANHRDVHTIFAPKVGGKLHMLRSMQCAVIQDAEHRMWVRLVGQEMDVQFWKTPDPRVPLPSDGARFFPDDLAPTEEWMYKLVEPVQRAFFMRSFWQPPIFLLLPEAKLTAEQNTVVIAAVCSKTGRKLKEIVVLRDHRTVHVYDLFSIGRRFYRRLVYTTNTHFALRGLQCSSADRRNPWQPWQRYAAGEFDAEETEEEPQSVVILRHASHPENRSKSLETFLPRRILEGLVPDALLDTHTFWQDPDDNIRGYPLDKNALHLLWVHWKELEYEQMTPSGGEKQVCLQVFRFARASSAPKVSEKAVLLSQRFVAVDEATEELERMRTMSTDAGDLEAAEAAAAAGEGMFREATTQFKPKAESATTEDYNLMLVNLLHAREGTPLHSLAEVLARLELLSHIVCWTTQVGFDSASGGAVTLDLIQMPRLKLSWSARADPDGNLQLYSLDHAHLFVSNLRQERVIALLQGIPHSLVLADTNQNVSIIVPAVEVVRPTITNAPFSTELVINRENKEWHSRLDTRYYLYPVHVSLSFMFTPTLASALYLLVLRMLHCEYDEAFRLAGTIGTDIEFSPEEQQNFDMLRITDTRPEACACFAKIGLLIADSPVVPCTYLPRDAANMIRNYNTIRMQCKLTTSEERRLLYVCRVLLKKLDLLQAVLEAEKEDLVETIVSRILNKIPLFDTTPSERKAIEEIFRKVARRVREELDIRISREETMRLLQMWQSYRRFTGPFSPYLRCIIDNRFAFLEAEARSIDAGGEPVPAELRVPPLGKDELWAFYRDYDPLSVKRPEIQQKVLNSENRTMKLSSAIDYFYCGAQVRKPGTCKCHDCGEECGPDVGCPCPPCEKRNREQLATLRYLPATINEASTRIMSFYDAFMLVENLYSEDVEARENKKNVPAECHAWHLSVRRYTMRQDNNGFLQYYEMLTGTTKVRIGSGDCAKDFAVLMFPLCDEARRPESALGHLMHYLVNNPQVWAKLPKFNRTSKTAFETQLSQIYAGIVDAASKNSRPPPPVPPPPMRETTRTVNVTPRAVTREHAFVPINTTRILPVLGNTDADKRVWGEIDAAQLTVLGTEDVTVDAATRRALATQPLEPAVPSGFLLFMTRAEQGATPISHDLPFDLKRHGAAATSVAKSMIGRLEQDMRDFAHEENESKFPKIAALGSDAVVHAAVHKRGPPLEKAVAEIQKLHASLVALRERDTVFVTDALVVVERTANQIAASAGKPKTVAEAVMHLRRLANQEAFLGLAYVLASVCSTTAEHDWVQLNPFLTAERCRSIMNLVVAALLRANRIGHINRAAEATKELLALLAKAEKLGAGAAASPDAHTHNLREALCASIAQKADALAGQLAAGRVYLNPTTFEFDPRFLIFEFTCNLVIRSRQRELIEEIVSSIATGTSIVKQMIMGAGKTTVVGPLGGGLMLANGRNLVMQVVPPALLDFTRSILRATFSSIIQKQIFCFSCDRASEVDSEVLSKFMHAKQSRGIVVTTPSAVKSIFLKYVEGLDRIEDMGRPPLENVEQEVHDLQKVLDVWRASVLIMDEVDLLLHPLKSELNFPIGEKHALDYAPTRWKLPIHLIDALFYFHTRRISVPLKESPEAHAVLGEIRDVIRRGLEENALQGTPHLMLLNTDFYDTQMRLPMARWLLFFLKAHHFVGLTDEQTLTYITTRPSAKLNPALNAAVAALEADHVKALNLSYEWLTAFLPHVLQKIDRVSFGIMNAADMRRAREEHPKMPRSRYVTAIPFIGKDLPSPSSEFAHPDVVIGLTIMAYRYEGLRKTDFTDIMNAVYQSVEKEVGRFHQRRTTIMYNKWVVAGGGRILQSFAYGADAQQQANAAAAAMGAEPSGMQQRQGTAASLMLDDDEVGMQPSESMHFTNTDEAGGAGAAAAAMTLRTPKSGGVGKAQLDVLPLKLMRQANEDETEKLFKLFRRTSEVIHWYLCEKIFPEFMNHQRRKLSASGQELGGTMLFDRRVGFSGTPSDLLPFELGKCEYEPGTDGKLIYTLTSPVIMGYSVVEPGWSVRGLLDRIANASPPFHALIDTGALITGMSNLQVAQYLLKHGLPQMEGVVFLDEQDRKMILVRATGRVLKLAECGIPPLRRLTFYDQVHTTGIDVGQSPNAVAVQTLGKDMTFRDFAQGAYRMRGIGQGQRVHILIIPEVHDLINRTLRGVRAHPAAAAAAASTAVAAAAGAAEHGPRGGAHAPTAQVLQDVTAWLLVNSIRSEHTQHNQLCIQTICNVWRKAAYHALLDACNKGHFKRGVPLPPDVLHALTVFREPVDYTVPAFVPQPRMFSETIEQFVENHRAFVRTDDGRAVVQGIIDQTKREDEIDNPVIDVQMVQEQEEEREATDEKEKQQEIEMEKFVDLAYSRDAEAAVPWALSSLQDVARAVQFYKLEDFHLYKRRPMAFPDNVLLSRNFFNPKWSGYRRIKNVILVLEWLPDSAAVGVAPRPFKDYGDMPEEAALAMLSRTVRLLRDHQGRFDAALARDFVNLALGMTEAEIAAAAKGEPAPELVAAVAAAAGATADELLPVLRAVRELLSSNFQRDEETGRYTVALSLAEAETVRRVIHARRLSRQPLVDGSRTEVCLTLAPANNIAIDATPGFAAGRAAFQRDRAFQCLRFFDNELQYTDQDVNYLLRSTLLTPPRQRQAFFLQLIQCRRRQRQRWERAPVALVFNLATPLTLLHQRTVGMCMRRDLAEKEVHLADAYLAINGSHSGTLSPDEVWGAMRFCRLHGVTADDVLDFIEVADTHHEGTVQYPDFLAMLTGSREIDDDEGGVPTKDDAQNKHLPTVEPHGAAALRDLRAEREAARRAQEAEANKEMASEDSRVRDEIEQEQMKEELALVQTSENPKLVGSSLRFAFDGKVVPKLMQYFGAIKPYQQDPSFDVARFLKFGGASEARALTRSVKLLTGAPVLSQYMLTVDFCIPRLRNKGKEVRTKLLTMLQESGEDIGVCLARFPTGAWKMNPGVRARIGGAAGDGDDDDDDDDGREDREDSYDEDDPYGSNDDSESSSADSADGETRIFLYSVPDLDRKNRLARVRVDDTVIEDVGGRISNVSGATAIEWMKVSRPLAGYVPFDMAGRRYWHRELLVLRLTASGQLEIVTEEEPPIVPQLPPTVFEEPKADDDDASDSSADSWANWFVDFEPEDEEGEDDDDGGDGFDMGDLTDLVEAIKKAKELKIGDLVSRNPEAWDKHGNEDGGEGSVGRVIKTEDTRVTVAWPNGFKGQYNWGENGVFELIKVGTGDDANNDGARDVENDDQWGKLLRKSESTSARTRCASCNQPCSLEPTVGWYRCNICTSGNGVNLCRKCFFLLEHSEHSFTDMIGLSDMMRTSTIVRGSNVRFRPDLKEPRNGWQDAPRDGTPGVVHDIDEDTGTVQVMFNEELWFGYIAELVVVDVKFEEFSKTYLGSLVYNGGVDQKRLRALVAVVEAQLAPPLLEGKYKVNQRVKALMSQRGCYRIGYIVGMPTPGYYSINFEENDVFEERVEESNIMPLPFVVGSRVRLVKNPASESFAFALQPGVTAGMIAEVTQFPNAGYHSDAVRVRVRLRNGTNVVSQIMLDTELELVGEAKWYVRKPDAAAASSPSAAGAAAGAACATAEDAAAAAEAEAAAASKWRTPIGDATCALLPKSAAPIIDRAFSDGVPSAEVFIRDAVYEVDFRRMLITNQKTREVFGELVRFPFQEWTEQGEKIEFDDGRWHVLTIIVNGDKDVEALCDGKKVTVDYTPNADDDADDADEEDGGGDGEDEEACEEGGEDDEDDGAASGDSRRSADGDGDAAREGTPQGIVESADEDVRAAWRNDYVNILDLLAQALLTHKPDTVAGIFDTMVDALENSWHPAGAAASGGGTMSQTVSAEHEAAASAAVAAAEEEQEEGDGDDEWEDVNEDEEENADDEAADAAAADDESTASAKGSDDGDAEPAAAAAAAAASSSSSSSADEGREDREDRGSASGSDDDGEGGARIKDLPRLKRTPRDFLSFDVRNPLSLFALRNGNAISQQMRNKFGADFPVRELGSVTFLWGAGATVDAAEAAFKEIDAAIQWACVQCDAKNSRLLDACAACGKERVETDDAKANKKAKVRVVMPRSKEAQEIRKRMHARLRAQYQKQLDMLDDGLATVI